MKGMTSKAIQKESFKAHLAFNQGGISQNQKRLEAEQAINTSFKVLFQRAIHSPNGTTMYPRAFVVNYCAS